MFLHVLEARELFETTKKDPLYVVMRKDEFLKLLDEIAIDGGLTGEPVNGNALNKRIMDLKCSIGRRS